MGTEDRRNASVEIPAHGDLLRSSLGVHIHNNDLGVGLFEQSVRSAEWTIVLNHENASLQVHYGVRHAAARHSLVVSAAGNGRGIICWTQHTSCSGVAILRSCIEIISDLFLIPHVIPGSEHVRTELEEFFTNRRRYTKTAGGILNIDYQQLGFIALDQMVHMLAHNLASWTSEDVAYKQNLHSSG